MFLLLYFITEHMETYKECLGLMRFCNILKDGSICQNIFKLLILFNINKYT